MLVGTVCMSHSPLMDKNRSQLDIESRYFSAIDKAAELVQDLKPDLTVVFFPDHINGFFYNLLPSICVGVEGSSIGDFGTTSGALDIPADLATECAETLLDAGIDVAISHRMVVDHGAVQPIELLSGRYPITRILPIFINCAAAPRCTFRRARALGEAVGEWARSRQEKILVIGSGGLSHDPPLPSLASAGEDVRRRLIEGGCLSHSQRLGRQTRALREGRTAQSALSGTVPLNPAWDRDMLRRFSEGTLTVLDDIDDQELTAIAGRGAHELRCWIAALAAFGGAFHAETLFYEPVQEWITGMAVLTAVPA